MVVGIIELFELEGGAMELIKILIILVAVIISLISFYFSKLQGARINALDIRKQTPLSPAYHTIIFTNYGNKTGVVIGPEIKGQKDMEASDKKGDTIIAIEPRGTEIREVEVYSNTKVDLDYHLEYKDQKGKLIKLPIHTYLAEKKDIGKKEEIEAKGE